MRKASVLKHVFVMTLVFTMLMDNILVMTPAAYAHGTSYGDETQAAIEEILHDEVPDSTPGKEESVPSATERGTDDKNAVPTETSDGGDGETTQADTDITEEAEAEVPSVALGAAAEQSDSSFVVLINSAPAYGLRVDYGQSLSFSLDGHTGSEELLYFYATPADAADRNWSDITDGVCTLEPGEYRIKYGVTIDQDWKTGDDFSMATLGQ